MGRKNRYESHVKPHLEEIKEWYQVLTEKQIAEMLGVSVTSFENYKIKYPELRETLQSGKKKLIKTLKETLKKKAMGYSYEETKTKVTEVNGDVVKKVTETFVKYAQPDTGAIHLLLKNLDDTWRNDDRETMNLKRERLELDKQKAENENW